MSKFVCLKPHLRRASTSTLASIIFFLPSTYQAGRLQTGWIFPAENCYWDTELQLQSRNYPDHLHTIGWYSFLVCSHIVYSSLIACCMGIWMRAGKHCWPDWAPYGCWRSSDGIAAHCTFSRVCWRSSDSTTAHCNFGRIYDIAATLLQNFSGMALAFHIERRNHTTLKE